jgi:hypothetical protein
MNDEATGILDLGKFSEEESQALIPAIETEL